MNIKLGIKCSYRLVDSTNYILSAYFAKDSTNYILSVNFAKAARNLSQQSGYVKKLSTFQLMFAADSEVD